MLAVARAHTIAGWAALDRELDAWAASGRQATFWWRDDDATRPGPKLDRLLATAGTIPVALAVIPASATADLAMRLQQARKVTVIQHGFAHTNHAPATAKKAEFGDRRPMAEMRAELRSGRTRLEALFGDRFVPVFVPPWNRCSDRLPGELAAQGFRGLSAFGPRAETSPIAQFNCHADIIDWRGTRGFLGTDAVIGRIVTHLQERRTSSAKESETTGLLTHHRDHDDACWAFIANLVQAIETHRAAAWQSPLHQHAGGR